MICSPQATINPRAKKKAKTRTKNQEGLGLVSAPSARSTPAPEDTNDSPPPPYIASLTPLPNAFPPSDPPNLFPKAPQFSMFTDRTEIGSGTYGTVYKATDKMSTLIISKLRPQPSMPVVCALKTSPTSSEIPSHVLRELLVLKLLSAPPACPYIASFHGVTTSPMAIILSYYPVSLDSILKHSLTPSVSKTLSFQLTSAITFMHSRGVTHRDIKPANILYSNRHRQLKLCDFGLSRTLPSRMIVSSSDAWDCVASDRVVSLWYRPIDLVLQQGKNGLSTYSNAIDVWGLGCVISELHTGEVLFRSIDERDKVEKVAKIWGKVYDWHHEEAVTEEEEADAADAARLKKWCIEAENKAYIPILFTREKEMTFGSLFEPRPPRRFKASSKILQNGLTPSGVDALLGCLKYNPARRLTARQVMAHEWWYETTASVLRALHMPTFDVNGRITVDDDKVAGAGEVTYDDWRVHNDFSVNNWNRNNGL